MSTVKLQPYMVKISQEDWIYCSIRSNIPRRKLENVIKSGLQKRANFPIDVLEIKPV